MAPNTNNTSTATTNENEHQDFTLPKPPPNRRLPQHGVNGVYYGGEWVDIEDCAKVGYTLPSNQQSSGDKFKSKCASCPNKETCPTTSSSTTSSTVNNKNYVSDQSKPRSKSALDASKDGQGSNYDVCIVGAGCIGSAIARELSKYQVSVLLLEAADDVSQGATKGNSGIVHAGYDDKPNTNRAKYCWKGNQMFEGE